MDLPQEQRFHFHDGSSAGSLEELARALARLSYVEFYRHVNPDKNDFANWVRHAVRDERLATELERVSSIVETIEIINDRLHPRAAVQPRTDAQSAIERDIFGDKYPAIEVPTTAPAQAAPAMTRETSDFTIIEESLDGHATRTDAAYPPMPERAQAQRQALPAMDPNDHARMIVKDFIFGFLIGLLIGALLGRMLP